MTFQEYLERIEISDKPVRNIKDVLINAMKTAYGNISISDSADIFYQYYIKTLKIENFYVAPMSNAAVDYVSKALGGKDFIKTIKSLASHFDENDTYLFAKLSNEDGTSPIIFSFSDKTKFVPVFTPMILKCFEDLIKEEIGSLVNMFDFPLEFIHQTDKVLRDILPCEYTISSVTNNFYLNLWVIKENINNVYSEEFLFNIRWLIDHSIDSISDIINKSVCVFSNELKRLYSEYNQFISMLPKDCKLVTDNTFKNRFKEKHIDISYKFMFKTLGW